MSQETLIIFTRYPEPGKTKTRMIPSLGAVGAAKLQRQMTEATVAIGRQLLRSRPISLLIYFAGGHEDLMASWLGQDLCYQSQSGAHLGRRMSCAFADAFATGKKRVVIIGTDCPDINISLIERALDALSQKDLILGPALDGGYYLIGLSRLAPALFDSISWGTGEVLSQTEAIASQLGLNVGFLPALRDVDRPEDLY